MTIAQHQAKAEQLLRAAGILPVVTVHTLDEARKVSAALKAYAMLVMSADKGAVRDLSMLGD